MRVLTLLTSAIALSATVMLAQDAPAPAPAPATSAPVVEYARVRTAHSHTASGTLGLGDWVTIEVEHFDKLLAQTGGNCAGIVLYLDARPMNGLTPESCNTQDGTVRFILHRTDQSDAAWHWLLGSPNGFTRKIRISVGPSNTMALASNVQDFPLRVIPRFPFYGWLILMAAFLVLTIMLCRRTALIRSTAPPTVPVAQRPYSLSRFQMAFWFFLVIAAYLFMWLITNELDTITDSVLALIGIGAGTALGSALIDSGGAVAEPNPPARGFLHDLLDDGSGISFHRFQMFVWTIVLGLIFIASVYRQLAMPEFSATLLGLMGISSGTYLGFKFPEKQNAESGKTEAAPPQG